MRSTALFPSLLISISFMAPHVVAADKIDPPTGSSVVRKDADLEKLFTRRVKVEGGLTEGPAVAPDGSIYFSDIFRGTTKGMILRFDPKTKTTTVFAANSYKSNGLIFNSRGELLACEGADYGGRGYSKWNVKSKTRTVIANRYKGKRFNAPNDICLDSKGRMYVTDPRYLGHEPRELKHRAVYRIEKNGTVIEVTHNVSKPNGIALSPDEKTLYVADHDNGSDGLKPEETTPEPGPMKVYAYPLGEDGLINGPRRTLVDFGKEAGCDGMTVDSEGRIYLTARSPNRPGVKVIDPKGKEVAFIPTGPKMQKPDKDHPPVGLPSNVEFGIGDEINVLYITVDTSLYRIRLKAKGYHRQYQ